MHRTTDKNRRAYDLATWEGQGSGGLRLGLGIYRRDKYALRDSLCILREKIHMRIHTYIYIYAAHVHASGCAEKNNEGRIGALGDDALGNEGGGRGRITGRVVVMVRVDVIDSAGFMLPVKQAN